MLSLSRLARPPIYERREMARFRWYARVSPGLYVGGRIAATAFGSIMYGFFVILGILGILALIYAII